MGSELLEAALFYASMGWPVFPLQPRQKKKFAVKSWKNDCTTDERQIRAWWSKNPNYNVGVVTGNGLGVIDVDNKPEKHGGIIGGDVLLDWEMEHGQLAETVCAKSGTGGMHYYYNIGDWDIAKCESPKISIDLRCKGGYIVAPPSIHPETGQPYTWDISPEDMQPTKIGDVERACFQWVWDSRTEKDGDDVKVSTDVETIAEGGRNAALFSEGRSLRSKGYDYEEILMRLMGINHVKCKPPLPDDEVERTAQSVCTVEPGFSDEVKQAQKKQSHGRTRKFDHAAVAKRLIAENGACFIDGMPAIRNGKLYEIGWKAVAREIIRLCDDATRANQKEVQHYLMIMAEQKQQSDPSLIAFRNGVLDIRTMQLRDYDETDVIPNIIPHDWKADAENMAVDTVLLKMACGESDILESLIEAVGMCLYRSAEFTQSAILLGGGSNGKSTYIRMIQALLGKENISSLDMSMLGKQFHTGQLAGKLANLGDDISNEFQKGELLAIFKKVVDGNRIFADVKGVEGFEFNPYAMQIFSANEFPRLADYTDGMLRRIFPIEFNAKFSKTDADYDPRISRKVATESACQRLAVLGVAGLQQAIDHNGFTPNTASSRRVEEIKADNNNTISWALDNGWTTETLDGAISMKLYHDYKEWCIACGVNAVSRNKFSREINKEYGLKTVPEWVDGSTRKVFRIA